MGLTGTADPEGFLVALDDHPTTVQALAARLEAPEDRIRERLDEAEAAGLAVDWGHDVWATTWRAKLQLHPGFFRLWLPVSIGIGLVVTALALWLNGPPGARWLVAAFSGLAVVTGALSLWARGR